MNATLITISEKGCGVRPMHTTRDAINAGLLHAITTRDLITVIGHDGESRWVSGPLPHCSQLGCDCGSQPRT